MGWYLAELEEARELASVDLAGGVAVQPSPQHLRGSEGWTEGEEVRDERRGGCEDR